MEDSLAQFSQRLEQRLALMRDLAESLASSCLPLARHDAEAVERGTACQAELCRRWSILEEQLRLESMPRGQGSRPPAELQQEWIALSARIRHLTRVHWSLLRHWQRSLDVLARLVASSGVTYAPQGNLRPQSSMQAGE